MWSLIIPAIAALAGTLFGKNQGQTSSKQLGQMTEADFQNLLSIPEIRDFMTLQQAQAARLDPLQQAVSQLAFQLLPVHARQGIDFHRVPTPYLPTFPGGIPASGSANPAVATPATPTSGYLGGTGANSLSGHPRRPTKVFELPERVTD